MDILFGTDEVIDLALKRMGFIEHPFQLSSNPRFLYLSSQHNDILKNLIRVVQNKQGLAVVQGMYGTGKTTLLKQLNATLTNYPDLFYIMYIESAYFSTEFALLSRLSAMADLAKRKNLPNQYDEFKEFALGQAKLGKSIILLLDDAHKMKPNSLNCIHELYNFEYNQKIIQTILCGQNEIISSFSRKPEIRSRVYRWIKIERLSLTDAFELINFRCRVAGRLTPLFSEKSFLKIHSATSGVPRYMVSLCSKILEYCIEVKNPENHLVDDDVVEGIVNEYKIETEPLSLEEDDVE